MTPENALSADTSLKAILQVTDSGLSADDRDREVQSFLQHIQSLEIAPASHVTYQTDGGMRERRMGVQVTLPEAERIRTMIRALGDRLLKSPVEIRLAVTLRRTRVQSQTRHGEDILALLPAIEALLPARQIFQGRAESYVLHGGELAPVAQANLELLRYRLNLPPDEAETMIATALGPYRDRQAKRQKYREVLSAEMDREHPLSDYTWAELRKLQQNLGLSYEDVADIDQEFISRIKAEATRLQAAEETTRLQQAATQQQQQTQEAQQTRQANVERYRQEFRSAIAHTLYPSDFDRGRLEQARRLWEIDLDQARAIERELTDAQYGPIDSAVGLDYSRLRQLLWLNQWEAADQETERLLMLAVSRDMRPLNSELVLQLPCVDLQTLDALWARYSQGRFGFQAQYQVYIQQERHADDFMEAVAWQHYLGVAGVNLATRRKAYHELEFRAEAPAGHLPSWRWSCTNLEREYAVPDALPDTFFLHLEKCMPSLAKAAHPSAVDREGQ